ncbi:MULTISPECIES: tyrosine-type recombinase/integrase [unclassified Kitasatospora]|uniref:tyrosine-type recombinase/integrase n=1 Tax=unclassified Kitasatospora TaxID=2633591 RepID=UPI0033DFF1C8
MVRLDDLGHSHIAAFTHAQLDSGRGKVTVHRCLATLSSTLGDAVRQRRLAYNPARPTVIPRPSAAERQIWTVQDAIHFLHRCRGTDPAFADLVEVLIGTGIRKGEALDLHWDDVHLPERVLYIQYTLSAVDNNRLVLTNPKTRSSKSWVAVSPRVATALRHRAVDKGPSPPSHADHGGFVFHRPDGRPLHPQYVLNHLHDLCRQFDVPRTAIHDLRHLAATISKTLRHATLSTAANIYGYLTTQAARDAVGTIDQALTSADSMKLPRPRTPAAHTGQHHNQAATIKGQPSKAS